jgi:hypothetical protein
MRSVPTTPMIITTAIGMPIIVQLIPEDLTVPEATAQMPICLLLALKVIALVSTFVFSTTH